MEETVYNQILEKIKKEGNDEQFEYGGYTCLIKRSGDIGHLCGYVSLDANHPCYEMDYNQIEEYYKFDLPSHGGLTYSGMYNGQKLIGFDCVHSGDISLELVKELNDNYSLDFGSEFESLLVGK